MKEIVVVEFIDKGEVIFRGTCSPGDEEKYVIATSKNFELDYGVVRGRLVAWDKIENVYSPRKVLEFLISV